MYRALSLYIIILYICMQQEHQDIHIKVIRQGFFFAKCISGKKVVRVKCISNIVYDQINIYYRCIYTYIIYRDMYHWCIVKVNFFFCLISCFFIFISNILKLRIVFFVAAGFFFKGLKVFFKKMHLWQIPLSVSTLKVNDDVHKNMCTYSYILHYIPYVLKCRYFMVNTSLYVFKFIMCSNMHVLFTFNDPLT